MDRERVLQFIKNAFVKCVQALIPVLEVLIMDFLEII